MLGIALVFAAACSPAASADRPTAVPGTWHGQTSDMPPAAGHRVGLWLEYVAGTDPVETQAAKSAAIAFTASCVTCAPETNRVEGLTTLQDVDADDLINPAAAAAHSAAITFPAAGNWWIERFALVVRVRAVDTFEPPMLHARPGYDVLPTGCTREKMAEILRTFIAGLNGDEKALASVSGPLHSFSLDGRPPRGVVANTPEGLMDLARAFWLAGDRFELVKANYAYPGGQYAEVALAPVMLRTVRVGNEVETRRMSGGAGMWCTQGGMMNWNLATNTASP